MVVQSGKARVPVRCAEEHTSAGCLGVGSPWSVEEHSRCHWVGGVKVAFDQVFAPALLLLAGGMLGQGSLAKMVKAWG